ncbi:MAG: DUF1906 domain-containing protein [Nitrospinota bacterium]|nr:MAG: DUF1906 domain-containing protein [Nitrospinota bacterium]
MRWGVDSSWYQVNQVVTVPERFYRPGEQRPVREPLFDYVTRRAGRSPEFWGRYLNDNHPPSRLRPDEPEYLFTRGCRLLLVYNGIRRQPSPGRRGRREGEKAARNAIRLARGYHVPQGVRIYLDLEGWFVQPEFLEGWWDVMYDSPYAGAGGIYGRGAEVRRRRRSPMPDLRRRPYSRGWAQRVLTAEDRVAERRWPGLLTDLVTGRHSKPYSVFIWTNTPRQVDKRSDTPPGAEIIPPSFGGVGPVGSLLTDTVIWQYRFSAFWERGRHGGTVDLDVALELAYQEMWGA